MSAELTPPLMKVMGSPSWSERMAEVMASAHDDKPTAEFFRLALEAAGELKAVRLKVLLSRAVAVIDAAIQYGDAPKFDDDFLDECRKELL